MRYWEDLESEHILKVRLQGFSHRLDGEYDRKQRIKMLGRAARGET